ncbi:hypothetical protein Leryth_013658 [Lithospermum erythrorhizon]|nr:hypothetical protein Leryth_013658 [Lithospermum erythrorhizon]
MGKCLLSYYYNCCFCCNSYDSWISIQGQATVVVAVALFVQVNFPMASSEHCRNDHLGGHYRLPKVET